MAKMAFLPLPDDLDPTGVKCIKLEIPDDVQWQGAFWGYLEGLARWFTWERDDAHSGAIMAEKYSAIIAAGRAAMNEGGCTNVDIRVKPTDSCVLQKTEDGTTWEDLINITDCADDAITLTTNNTIQKGWRISGGVTQYTIDNVTYNNYSNTQYNDFGAPTAAQANDPSGVDKKCIRSKNNVAFFMAQLGELSHGMAVGASVTTLIAGVIGLVGALFTGGTSLGLSAAATAFCAQVVAAGNNFLVNLFTGAVLNQLQCDLESAFETDGSMTTAGFATLIALFDSRGAGVWTIISYWFKCLGPIGMVWAGTQGKGGVSTCDVDPCSNTLIREFNFLESPCGWNAAQRDFQEVTGTITQGSKFTGPAAEWVSGLGWCTQYVRYYNSTANFWITYILLQIPHAINVNRVTFEADYLMSPAMTALSNKIGTLLGYNASGAQILSQNFGPQFNTNPTGIVTGDISFTSVAVPTGGEIKVQIDVLKIGQSYGPPYGGYCRIRKARFYGSE